MTKSYLTILLCSVTLLSCSNNEAAKPFDRDTREVPFVTTPQVAVDRMLELAKPTSQDKLLDLGCGDGRFVITAAKKYGCSGIGYDIDPILIELCKKTAKNEGVDDLVKFYQQDIFQAELPTDATIVTMYLSSSMNLRLVPYLQTLADGARVVTHHWGIPGVQELKKETIETGVKLQSEAMIFYFKTPLLIDPAWKPRPRSPEDVEFNKIKHKVKFAPRNENSKQEPAKQEAKDEKKTDERTESKSSEQNKSKLNPEKKPGENASQKLPN